MTEAKVDRCYYCPECGMELIVDAYDESVDCLVCPWCGQLCEIDSVDAGSGVCSSMREVGGSIEEADL